MSDKKPWERVLEFDVLLKDRVLHSVKIDFGSGKCHIQTFTDIQMEKEFMKDTLNLKEMLVWVESRCFMECGKYGRYVLSLKGMTEYNPYEVIKVTHGIMSHDLRWIRFKGEDLTYEQAKMLLSHKQVKSTIVIIKQV